MFWNSAKRRLVFTLACAAALTYALRLSGDGEDAVKVIGTKGGVEMILIPAGDFRMGSDKGRPDEKPVRKVVVSAFLLDKYPVTQKEYQRLMGENPSKWKDPDGPVDTIRWSDAARYCNARSKEDGLEPCYNLETWECDFSRNGYRLPTEAEWEYACRAGSSDEYHFGDNEKMLQIYAWYEKNSGKKSRPVGRKRPNKWGLYDMTGNLWEWCNDYYKADYYGEGPEKDPRGPEKTDMRVLRGGCWNSKSDDCKSATRNKENPAYADACFGYDIYGFRCARNAPREEGKKK